VGEYSEARIDMRERKILISAESDASVWPLGLALWRRRSTGGGCQVSPRYMAGRSGSSAWSAGRCRAGLAGDAVRRRLAVCGCRMVLGPCRGFRLRGGGPLQLAAATRGRDHRVAGCAWGRGPAAGCAGQAVLRTVSVAVRTMGRLDARGHGHIADSVGGANAERRRLRRSAAIWCG
jgi:hypothetical protein